MSKKTIRKKTYKKKPTSSQKSAPINWLIVGVIIGLLIPGIFYLKTHSLHKDKAAEIYLATEEKKSALKPKKEIRQAKANKKTHHQPEPESKRSNYDFYNLLSSQEETGSVKESPLDNRPKQYVLEIGTFNSFAKADQLKAQLLLIGIDHVGLIKDQSLYKVISGPYTSKEEMLRAQKQLKENSVKSTLVLQTQPN